MKHEKRPGTGIGTSGSAGGANFYSKTTRGAHGPGAGGNGSDYMVHSNDANGTGSQVTT